MISTEYLERANLIEKVRDFERNNRRMPDFKEFLDIVYYKTNGVDLYWRDVSSEQECEDETR